MRYHNYIIFTTLAFVLTGCDFIRPQQHFRLAVPKADYFYHLIGGHLKQVLESRGFSIDVVDAPNGVEANRMVSRGDAELSLTFNHSIVMARELGPDAANIRTLYPLVSSVLFAFSREPLPPDATSAQLFSGKRIGLQVLNGETEASFERMLSLGQIEGYQFVEWEDKPDVIVYWGTYYGKRTTTLLQEGWHHYSFTKDWIEFQVLNEPAVSTFSLPAIPGNPNSRTINTLSSHALLVANSEIGENSAYQLISELMQSKLELVHTDMMYRSLSDGIDPGDLLYPLHEGTYSYLRRDEPSFLERYADAIALAISMIAVLYGAFQALTSRIAHLKKEQLDKYIMDFMDVRSRAIEPELKITELDSLFQRAVIQMTNEKIEKSDFHILSRLIQQEIANMRRV